MAHLDARHTGQKAQACEVHSPARGGRSFVPVALTAADALARAGDARWYEKTNGTGAPAQPSQMMLLALAPPTALSTPLLNLGLLRWCPSSARTERLKVGDELCAASTLTHAPRTAKLRRKSASAQQ
jgi:hypothetical protein